MTLREGPLLRAWQIACRTVGALTIVLLLLTAFTSLPNAVARRFTVEPDVAPADAIVVLGVSINSDGSLADASLRRAIAGIRLFRDGLAPRIVFLGMSGEAEARARLAIAMGVERSAILTEGHAPTTRAEAAAVRGRLRGLHSVLLVTDVFHIRRARALFEREGFTVRPAPMDRGVLTAATPEKRLLLARGVAEEMVALTYHKLFHYL